MRNIDKERRKGFRHRKFKFRYKLFVMGGIFVLGSILIVMITKFSFLIQSNESPDLEQIGTLYSSPLIFLACNEPYQEFTVFSETDDVGETELVVIWKESENTAIEELHVWLVAQSFDSPFLWNIENNALAMDVFSLNGKDYRVTQLEQESGTGYQAAFCINFIRVESHTARITMKIKEEDYIVKNQGKWMLKLPVIMLWTGYNKEDLQNKISFDDLRWINKTLEEENLYPSYISVKANIINLTAKNSNLILNSIMPESYYYNESVIAWDERAEWIPQVCYIDRERYKLLEISAAILGGMGSSCFILGIIKTGELKKVNEKKRNSKEF